MKIAIIQPRTSYYVAGSEKVSIRHAEFLSMLGHTIDFYTTKTSDKSKETFLFKEFVSKKLLEVNIFQFNVSKLIPDLYTRESDMEHLRWITESIEFDRKIFDELKKNRPDVILSYYLPDSLFKPSNIPNVLYISGYPSSPVPLYKSFIKFCDAIISISSIVSEKWSKELEGMKLNYILGTGVDYPVNIKSKVKTEEKYNLVFAGRLIERKGILTLLDAFKKILGIKRDVHLWILGEGELRGYLNKRINSLNLEHKITITGLVNNPYDYFNIADICIFPSHKGDGLMGTVLESMASGKPVITTINNGNEDIIINNDNGILIEPESVDAIVSAILELLKDEVKRKTMGKKAQKFIADKMTWNENVKQLSNILADVINKTKH